ncbi:MAG: peptidylprolyl isomerase [Planctomycetales bacterium]|nr:peptidylprolyl isomerase [Planctomycetales bacterium]
MNFKIASFLIAALLMIAVPTVAQETKVAPARAQFEEIFSKWKDNLKKLRDLNEKHTKVADDADVPEIRKEFKAIYDETEAMIPELRNRALSAYLESPNTDRDLTRMLISMASDALSRDMYSTAKPISDALMSNGCDEKALYDIAGTIAYSTDDFTAAEELLKEADDRGVLNLGKDVYPTVSEMKELWAKELEIREAEAKADDLPRVKLATTKGDIVLELFENEAPDTVGNFVSLIERGFYDGLTFHRVLPGFMAQGGDPQGDGTGGPGYNIYCECYEDNYRRHFSGTLSMAKSEPRDTGGSQFFITFKATPHLNGKHTAFGRVIEGMDVLERLQRIDPDTADGTVEPDKIEKAEVIRKREHEYVPNKAR